MQQREYVVLRQLLATLKEVEFDHKCQSRNLRAQSAGQVRGCDRRSAGRQQVVHDQNALAFFDGIFVDFQRVAAIFEFIPDLYRFGRQLSQLADRNESRIQPVGQRRSKDKSARLDAEHYIDLFLSTNIVC